MKTVRFFATLLMVAVCVMFVTSCGDDRDKDGGDLSKSIVGTWKITAWESNEGTEGMIGEEFAFKQNGFATVWGETDVAKWSIRKKGETLKHGDYGNVILSYDAVVLIFLEDVSGNDPYGILIKERKSDTMSVSLLDFELRNDANHYSRGTWKKIK